MRKWELSLYDKYFGFIKSGRKTVEGRAPSESRDYTQMKPGDILVFTNLDTNEKITVVVEKVVHYSTVEEMLKNEGLENCLPSVRTIQKGVGEYYAIPGYKERIQRGGIFAIRLFIKKEDT